MSGGGAYGAYQTGVLDGMYNILTDKQEMAYDVISGVSAGSLNTLGTALFAKGDEGGMITFLTDLWTNVYQTEVMTRWKPFGIVEGVLEKAGLFDDSPLLDFLHEKVKEYGPVKDRHLIFNAADANSGSYV